jgi:hypothetical protein
VWYCKEVVVAWAEEISAKLSLGSIKEVHSLEFSNLFDVKMWKEYQGFFSLPVILLQHKCMFYDTLLGKVD